MDYIKLIAGYVLLISGSLIIRSQGINYSKKKAFGLLLVLVGAVLLFFVAWWHIIIGLVLGAVVAVISGKKSGIEKEFENTK